MNIKTIRRLAAAKKLTVGTQRDQHGWSYWLLDANGKDLFADDNFYTNLADVKDAIEQG